jgi:FAD:protein FMN transferase
MNRRDFLRPAHLAYPAGQFLATLGQLSTLTEPRISPRDVALLRLSRQAMATTFEVVVPYGTPDALELGNAALDRIDELEAQLTVYRDTSQVARLNRLAAYQPVVVEARLFALLQKAQRITSETNGAFDISCGALIRAWGFLRGPRRIPDDEELAQVRQRNGMDKVVLDPKTNSVRFLSPGLEINLGSIGKGYALDLVGSQLTQDFSVPAFLLQGGYSSVLAHGSPHQDDRGWMVVIRHPRHQDRPLARVWLHDQGLATSANTYQAFEWQGRQLGHLLNPRTSWPAEGMASVTVVAPTSAEADALSTAFFILGSDAARDYCETHPEIGVIVLADGDDAEPELMGLPLDAVRLDQGQRVAGSFERVAP